jgi:hypothetical protein
VCWCLAFEIVKSRTLKPRSVGPTVFPHFAIRQTTWSFVFLCSAFVIAETRLTSVFSQNCRNIVGIICYRNNSNTVMNGLVETMEDLHPG